MKLVRIAVIVIFIGAAGVFVLSVVREFQNRDRTEPVITSDREVLELTCDYTQEELLEGMSASDEKDGDLTGQILCGNMTRFIEPGVCQVTYVVFDSGNQSASLTRKVQFTDYESPTFSLSEPLVYEVGEGDYQTSLDRIGATDLLDGNRKEWITQTESDVSYGKAGSYHMTLEVSNSYGDSSELAFPVHVLEEEENQVEITLKQGLIYVKQGETLHPEEYIDGVQAANGSSLSADAVSWENGVNSEVPGVYEIHYTAEDRAGNFGNTWLTVVVKGEVADES